MAGVAFYNMRLLCYIDDTDFTDYQGIGSDPMYKRYESVLSVIKNHIDPAYQDFLARPLYDDGTIKWYATEWSESPVCYSKLNGIEKDKYSKIKDDTISHYRQKMGKMNSEDYAIMSGALKYIDEDFIYCYDNKIVLVAWGMRPDSSKHKVEGSWIKGLNSEEKIKVFFDAGINGKLKSPIFRVLNRTKGYKLTKKDIPELQPVEGYKFLGWSPNPIDYEVNDEITFTAQYHQTESSECEKPKSYTVRFETDNKGTIKGDNIKIIPSGSILSNSDIPDIESTVGYKFIGWTPTITMPITSDMLFVAEYAPNYFTCEFQGGEHGTIVGNNIVKKSFGNNILDNDIPKVKPNKGYKFKGWNISPMGVLNSNKVVYAEYEKIEPWYKRIWLWFTGKGCLKWIIWLILLILLLWILSWLLKGCDGHSEVDRFGNPVLDDDAISKIEQIRGDEGRARDNNGIVKDITEGTGQLPEHGIVAPIIDEDGETPSIEHNEGAPDIIANRLNIYFEDEHADLEQWAKDFKKAYPSEDYCIIGWDENVRMIQIQIPEDKRNIVREELNSKLENHKFFVIDESIITLQGNKSKSSNPANIGWHIKATNLIPAWNTTQGAEDVVVAIVDDGIDVNHTMFTGRFYKAYNVFTQNRTLSAGVGHGTHVAGLAVGSADYIEKGVTGVAPKCKIMPIQVFDNGICTFSSIASGIMYAIHNGADVVNISIGPSFKGLDRLPISEQEKIASALFKNEERVYRHIIKTANEKNVILVFAAGNDNILTSILPECRFNKNSINVAAVSPQMTSADFTNYAIGTNVSAPGVDIYSAFPSNSFKMLDGTSMAAPIVAGAIALMRSIKNDITVEQVIAAFYNSGRPIDNYIPKMLLIDNALTMVKEGRLIIEQDKTELPTKENLPEQSIQGDDYSTLRSMLEQLKAQRDKLNEQINDIEKKLK